MYMRMRILDPRLLDAGYFRGGAECEWNSVERGTMRWSSNGRLLASLVLLGFALALYANSLKGDFVFDDHAAIQVNPDVRWVYRTTGA